MDGLVILELILAIIVLVIIVMVVVVGFRDRAIQRQRVGPEVGARGSERDAPRPVRGGRWDQLDIRPLHPAARARYTRRWEAVQTEFVDRPAPAVDEADQLVTDVMHDRGYPVEDLGERTGLVAAHHPQIAEHYRAARALRQGYHRGHVGQSGAVATEDLRQAFGHYRALFDELVHGR